MSDTKRKSGIGGVLLLALVIGLAGIVMSRIGRSEDQHIVHLHAEWVGGVPIFLHWTTPRGSEYAPSQHLHELTSQDGHGQWDYIGDYVPNGTYDVTVQGAPQYEHVEVKCQIWVDEVQRAYDFQAGAGLTAHCESVTKA